MVEADNVQGFERDSHCTGFESPSGPNCGTCSLGSKDSTWNAGAMCQADYDKWLEFNKWLADETHALGMGIALKDNRLMAKDL
jgi:hypothetical protein